MLATALKSLSTFRTTGLVTAVCDFCLADNWTSIFSQPETFCLRTVSCTLDQDLTGVKRSKGRTSRKYKTSTWVLSSFFLFSSLLQRWSTWIIFPWLVNLHKWKQNRNNHITTQFTTNSISNYFKNANS